MQDRTIDSALLALRKQIIRGGGQGLAQVESLLHMRGVDIPRVLPAKRKDVARKGEMTRIILDALQAGPMPLQSIASHVAKARPDSDPDRAYSRTAQALHKLKAKGLVRREGQKWVAPHHEADLCGF